PHQRVVQVVVRAVERARGQVVGMVVDGGHVLLPAARVVQVLGAQRLAESHEDEDRNRLRELVPAVLAVELGGELLEGAHCGSFQGWGGGQMKAAAAAARHLRGSGRRPTARLEFAAMNFLKWLAISWAANVIVLWFCTLLPDVDAGSFRDVLVAGALFGVL